MYSLQRYKKFKKNLHYIGFIIIFARQFNFLLLIMNKTRFLFSFLFLTILFGFLFPTTVFAQYDDFFRDKKNENRDVISPATWTITNQGIGQSAPLEGGLLVLMAAGAGYAALRRKRKNNSQNISLILAFVMLLGLTQCKKKIEPISNNTYNSVYITLNVGDGSKVNVTPGFEDPETHEIYAKVTFETGDRIYVGNNGKYCGYLDYTSTGENTGYFSGTITPTSADDTDYLHFYFMGNKTPLDVTDLTVMTPDNNTETFSVNITDQTVKYPVISYARSTNLYNSGVTTYSARLLNYCAIMKFTTSDKPMTNPVTISGMCNKVTVNFAANKGATIGDPYSYAKMSDIDEGDITLHAETNTERWAILLPQTGIWSVSASAEGCYSMTTISLPGTVVANGYYTNKGNGYTINLVQLIDGAFSINKDNNTQVFFAPGNLQCTTSDEPDGSGFYDWSSAAYTWSFKEHQYDIDNKNSDDVGENCKKVRTISHFNWATSGWDNTANDAKATNFQPYATDFTDYAADPTNRYHYGPTRKGTATGQNTTDTVNITGTNYDWGKYCSYTGTSPYKITNGGEYSWRLLTVSEQSYILGPNTNPKPGHNCRRTSTVNGVPNARFIKACLTDASNGTDLGLYGLIIFPDTYIHPDPEKAPLPTKINDPNSTFTDNNYTIAQWTEMEKAKAVFLPAAGCRWGQISSGITYYKIQDINKHCYYWSSSDDISNPSTNAKNCRIGLNDFVSNSSTSRCRANSVRLVRIATTSK